MPPRKAASSESSKGIPNDDLLRASLSRYDVVLEERANASSTKGAAELPKLDRHLWENIGVKIRDRGHATLDELKDVMRWKLLRGKFRPTLPALIASNSPDSVETTTRAAFSVYLKRTSPTVDARTARECLRELCNLRGVGPATASLLMAIVNPVGEPFMSDESWECLPELSGRKIAYKESDWVVWREAFMHKLGDATDQGGGAADSWDREGARGLDKACWAYKHGQAGSGVSSAPEQILNTDKRGAQKGKPDRKSSEEQVKEARGSKRKAVASDDIQDPPKGRKAGARRKKNA